MSIHLLPFSLLRYSYLKISPWNPRSKSWVRSKLKSHSGSNILSIQIPFVPSQLALAFLRYGYFNILPWKFKVQIMAWCQPSHKPLSEPIMASFLTHILVTRPQWVKRKNIFHIHVSAKCRFNLNHEQTHATRQPLMGSLSQHPLILVKSLPLISRLGTHRFHLLVPYLQMDCRDLTT